ncbi:hypothetical protein DSO57_1022893 [Entomophthora muscae]|uniref:Uncharacterized protein n=1 Tax=Entomophthora muscae TaxID=34485 RepID=A0ACC2T353_9FUNG|nr:hypothetical protein DSO57_1022893 [Entomophthora muscae]
METYPGSGTSTEYCNNSKWAPVVSGKWYTISLFSLNSPTKQKTQTVYINPVPTSLFCPFASASLLVYLGRYQIFGELVHLGMVSVPIGFMITGLNPSALIHHAGKLFQAGWFPEILSRSLPRSEKLQLAKISPEGLDKPSQEDALISCPDHTALNKFIPGKPEKAEDPISELKKPVLPG